MLRFLGALLWIHDPLAGRVVKGEKPSGASANGHGLDLQPPAEAQRHRTEFSSLRLCDSAPLRLSFFTARSAPG
jgi:hypothetical protein